MRICGGLCLFFMLLGLSAAQETNFAVGPQYLLTGSPLFARPIATPSLTLGTSISTATPSINDENSGGAVYESTPQLNGQSDLIPIYYGEPRVSVVEVSLSKEGSQALAALPASIVQTGVSELVDMQALKLRGYGVTLPEASAYWKTHKAVASHHYTNTDIERLRATAK